MDERIRRIFLCMFTETEVVVFQTTVSTVLPRFTNIDHSDNIYQPIHNVTRFVCVTEYLSHSSFLKKTKTFIR
jgi:hypothetical protein